MYYRMVADDLKSSAWSPRVIDTRKIFAQLISWVNRSSRSRWRVDKYSSFTFRASG